MSTPAVVNERNSSSSWEPNWRTVHRVVFPEAGDVDTMPLYADFSTARHVQPDRNGIGSNNKSQSVTLPATETHPDYVLDRRRLKLPAHGRVSLGTYFNAFPGSYWRAHTDIRSVRLSVQLDGDATVTIYRSTARGIINRVSSQRVGATEGHTLTVELPLNNFGDGGWYWFDLAAHREEVTLQDAHWSVPEPEAFSAGKLTIAITTFNRPDYCVRNLATIASSTDLMEVLHRVVVTDQGTRKVAEEEGFSDVESKLNGRLATVNQTNLGGSGGFARGMMETIRDSESSYVMLLDDDVEMETEGMLRAAQFADFTTEPTIVGGHMFNLFERSVMHHFGESVDRYRFRYGLSPNTEEAHDFAASNLRDTPWMHRRIDVDYNGWWMCLIPTEIINDIGLALPVFIKWDDVEYGIRAQANGYRTATLPGAAVWHMPWTEKDDTIDWQAYYHQRNRWLATLLYSPYKRGGRMPQESFAVDVRHLLSMQYSSVELRLRALEDLLSGPDHLHETLGSKLPEVRAVREQFDDARIAADPKSFPLVKRSKPPRKGKGPTQAHSIPAALVKVASGVLHQIKPVPDKAKQHPEEHVAAMDARWWRLSHLDSALVTSSDGAGVSWHKRDAEKARELALRSAILHRRLLVQWDDLAELYKSAMPQFTSPAAWADTFAAAGTNGNKAE
ncbi:glycosyltransferase [Arthrobacter sp. EH-1B-1]|uniref:Glycosyltransferase n=1 Tax=Arthrobacter vasquezii TaxID=2977629 RepID=A0ABT6CTI3_9MICC|nr:glycosyltransferase [Arthrobacter vasquezii]MDF9277372.1 glycosyltransferase [Arthrobacter vasquezii]